MFISKVVDGVENPQYRLFHVRDRISSDSGIRTEEEDETRDVTKKKLAYHATGYLSEQQVRSIFCNVLDEKIPCDLVYKVIPTKKRVGPPNVLLEGTTISSRLALYVCPFTYTRFSSSHNTEGIYILCDAQKPELPQHLRAHLLMELPTEDCRWTADGPRSNHNCGDLYERSFTTKSGERCAVLWTMVRHSRVVSRT